MARRCSGSAGDRIELLGSGVLTQRGDFTVTFWGRVITSSHSGYCITARGPFGNRWAVYWNSSLGAYTFFEFFDFGLTFGFVTGSEIVVSDAEYHHIAYRKSGSEWAKFLDGTKTVIDSSFSGSLPIVGNTFVMGDDTGDTAFAGDMAELRAGIQIYSDERIAAMAAGFRVHRIAPLENDAAADILWPMLDVDYGGVEPDWTARQFNGTHISGISRAPDPPLVRGLFSWEKLAA